MSLICKYCENRLANKINVINNYAIYKCDKCSLIQTEVDLKQAKVINLAKYNDNYLKEYINLRKKSLIKFYIKIIHLINKYKYGGSLLDIGCGPGFFLEAISKSQKHLQWEVQGIDINKKSLDYVDKKFKHKVVNCSIDSNNFKDITFDVVTCFDSIEHFSNLKKSLYEINRILKTGGLFIIQVPNYDSTMRKLCGNDWDWWCIPDHLYHFQFSSIKNILYDYGFDLLSVNTWEPYDVFLKNIQGHIKKIIPSNLRLNKILAKLALMPLVIVWIIQRIVNTRKGGLMYIFAQKQ